MENRLSFGIGCFHFGIKKIPPFKFKVPEYIKELRTVLQSISNIDNINIYCDDRFTKWSMEVTGELPNIEEGNRSFPNLINMAIGFDVFIPFRIQKQLLKILFEKEAVFLKTYTERFKISLHYTHHFPVTFIEPINPSQESNPTNVVIIVREFLEKEFESSKSDYIRFEFLGPSPFHAKCYIQPGETKDNNNLEWKFQTKIYPQKYGDDEIVFYFNPVIFTKVEEAKKAIKKETKLELGFYYSIVQSENVRTDLWEAIFNLINDLISIQQMKGVKGFMKKKFALSKHINKTFIYIAEFESSEILGSHWRQKFYRDIYYDKKREIYFQSYIDNEINERVTYPIEEMVQLISFFESRRTKSLENFVIFISAIIAVVIGALLTKWIVKF